MEAGALGRMQYTQRPQQSSGIGPLGSYAHTQQRRAHQCSQAQQAGGAAPRTKYPPVSTKVSTTMLAMVCAVLGTATTVPISRPRPWATCAAPRGRQRPRPPAPPRRGRLACDGTSRQCPPGSCSTRPGPCSAAPCGAMMTASDDMQCNSPPRRGDSSRSAERLRVPKDGALTATSKHKGPRGALTSTSSIQQSPAGRGGPHQRQQQHGEVVGEEGAPPPPPTPLPLYPNPTLRGAAARTSASSSTVK